MDVQFILCSIMKAIHIMVCVRMNIGLIVERQILKVYLKMEILISTGKTYDRRIGHS